jgi:hypothetical protein
MASRRTLVQIKPIAFIWHRFDSGLNDLSAAGAADSNPYFLILDVFLVKKR